MVEINITSFFENADPFNFSASVAERGMNAGRDTWNNAVLEGTDSPLLTTWEQIGALRDHVTGYGAWDRQEIAAWSDAECNALFIQLISGDMREDGLDGIDPDDFDWDAYEERAAEGQISGNIFRSSDGQIYYSLSD